MEGDYYLQAEIKYLEDNILKKGLQVKKFSIKKEQDNLISIKPPYLVFNQNEKNFFRIDLKNIGDNNLNVKISDNLNLSHIFNNNLIIAKGSEDSFYFNLFEESIKDREKINIDIKYNEKIYKLPVYILKENENLKFFTKSIEEKKYVSSYDVEIPFGNYAESILFVENFIGKDLFNLSISLRGDIKNIAKLGFYEFELKNNKSAMLNFYINQDRKAKGDYLGDLIVKNAEIEVILPISIKVAQEAFEEVKEPEREPIENKTEQEFKNQTIKKEQKISNKTIVYMSVLSVFVLFFAVFLIIYLKTGKRKKFRR